MKHDPLTILVVDDEVVMRLYLATVLRKNGYTVLEAQDGAEALTIMREREGEIAAVISDIRMPNIDGLKLAELNFHEGFLPFIACTSISDAATALKFIKFGVQDYVVKPMVETVLMRTVRDAIGRRRLSRLFTADETPLPGNMGAITIPASFAAMDRAQRWLELKAGEIMPPAEQRRFLAFASEFLMNAYEHGSLRLTEEEKSALLENGGYFDELQRREMDCKTKIDVAVSTVENELAVHVTDEGYGFNYKRYLNMPASEMLGRVTMPNGRGIQIAMEYFDSVTFSKGGAAVLLTKKYRKANEREAC